MNRKGIEWGFVDAGWELDGGFSGYLIIGEDGDQSILAHQWVWGTEDPMFELSSSRGTSPTGSGRSRHSNEPGNCSKSTAGRLRRSGATPTNRVSKKGGREKPFRREEPHRCPR